MTHIRLESPDGGFDKFYPVLPEMRGYAPRVLTDNEQVLERMFRDRPGHITADIMFPYVEDWVLTAAQCHSDHAAVLRSHSICARMCDLALELLARDHSPFAIVDELHETLLEEGLWVY